MKPHNSIWCHHKENVEHNGALRSRREFLRTAFIGSLAAAALPSLRVFGAEETAAAKPAYTSKVALTTGEDRANNIFRALKVFETQIARDIGNKRVIIKPNNVLIDNSLCATAPESIEGILEFLKSIGKTNVVIAESCASGSTLEGFDNYKYTPLGAKYNAKLIDLDQEAFDVIHAFDETDFRPHAVRVSKLLLDRDNYIISDAKFKTHDRAVATLSLKNIVVGAPVKDPGFKWGGGKEGAKSDKGLMHGNGFRGINYNLYAMASRLRPDLAVIDGYEGMEGNGPTRGMAVQHRVAVVSPDWLAADRVGIELMGIDFASVGYLNFCADAKMGEADLAKIEIAGPAIKEHVKQYKLADNIEQQLIWKKPVQASRG